MNILLIDTDPNSTMLFLDLTRNMKTLKVKLIHVDVVPVAIEYLNDHSVDMILLALDLSDNQGIDPLRLLQNHIHFIPIIVMSDRSDDRFGLQTVREGGCDFLLKDEINEKSLTRTIICAIERQQTRQIQEDWINILQRSESVYRNMIGSLLYGIIIVDQDGVIQFANAAGEVGFRCSPGGLIGRSFVYPIIPGGEIEIDMVRDDRTSVLMEMQSVYFKWRGNAGYLITLREIIKFRQEWPEQYHKESNEKTLVGVNQ